MIRLISLFMVICSMANAKDYNIPFNWSGGGFINSYMAELDRLNTEGYRVKIETQGCISACTFFLAAEDVCVSPKTIFHFHGVQSNIMLLIPVPVSGMPKERHSKIVNEMADTYNGRWPGLGDWFLENAADKAGFLTTDVRGSSLNEAFGIPLCEQSNPPSGEM